jgi:hypothetical protein
MIEDAILMMYEEDPADDSNSVLTKWHNTWKEVMKDRDTDIWSSLKYESLIKESGAFSEVNVTKLKAPLSGQTDGENYCLILKSSDGGSFGRPNFEAVRGSHPKYLQHCIPPTPWQTIRSSSHRFYGAGDCCSDE